jgi:gliding motility-associated-like protein
MRKVTIKLTLLALMLLGINVGLKAQSIYGIPVNYVFSSDSLTGFDEQAAIQGAFDVEAYGEEFKVYMYHAKRSFIDKKYNLTPSPILLEPDPSAFKKTFQFSNNGSNAKGPGNPVIAVASCTNEDFEEGSLSSPVPGTITVAVPNAVNGWTCQGASNSSGGTNGNCTNTYVYGNPNPIRLFAPGSGGFIDPIIGSGYPIYSVFGNTTTSYPAATTANGFQCYGDWFIRLNDQVNGSSVNRIVKTISPVTASNALFQFAFISVLEGSHGCCDGGGFSLKVKIGCSATPVTTTCPQFTAAVQAGCTSPGNSTSYLTSTINPSWKYNKWKLNTLDLTSYIGNCVTIEVTAFDCTYSHAGYVYFDAQCSPMDIIGNGNSFPAGTPSISLPTCGTGNTATITAPSMAGGYTWTPPPPCSSSCYTVGSGPGILPNQQIITGITGNYTLTMNPPGSCSPITRTINVIISPAPNLAITTPTMYSCSNPTLNGAGIQMGSGTPNAATTPNYTVNWSPAPSGTIGTSANSGTYTGLSVGVNTITISDSVGCTATQTLNVTPAPQVPTITISAPSGTVIGCNPPSIQLIASNTNTALTNMTYTWQSITTGSATGTTINATAPGGSNTYTVSGYDPVANSCIATAVITVSANTAAPSLSISPTFTQALTCNGACKSFTATSSTTTNIVGTWFDPSNAPMNPPSGTPLIMCANSPGTYTAQFCNLVNGCCTSETVAVTANTIIPTITITPVTANGFTINCTNPCVQMNINSSSTIAPTSYSWTNLSTSVTTTPANGGYTTCIPGQFVASFKDGNACVVSNTITIYIDTLRPSPTATTNLPSGSHTLNCNPNSCLIATAITNPMLPISSYSWTVPPGLTSFTNQVQVCLANVTSSTSPTTYTVLAIGANGCVGKAKVLFYKDVYVPPYSIAFTPTAITCSNPCIALTGVSSQTTPVSYTFTSPPPTQTATTAGALMCSNGTYTMQWTNLLNGCTSQTTNVISLNTTPPGTVVMPPVYLPCGQTTTVITAGTTTTSTTYSYNWEGPSGAGFSCASCYSTQVNQIGDYGVTITNTVNGCISTNTLSVVPGTLVSSFTPDPVEGYAPLSVNFTNQTQGGSITSGSVTTTWNYGNGTSITTTSASSSSNPFPNGMALYSSAGNYTVWLITTQYAGTVTCSGTSSAVVHVELPSDLTIPNVFTPNGDGVNDEFTLLTTNLTEVTCQIFDRWGVKMYDVTSDKGNINWDGKNFANKDVPPGTYFYILKAKGKDNKDFEQKGTISLYR